MSVATELTKLNTNIKNAYDVIEAKDGTVPQNKNTDNLPTAINSIPAGGGGRDWSEIGYSSEPKVIQYGIDYAKQIQNNWDSSITNRSSAYSQNFNIIYFPLVDTSKISNARGMFSNSSIQVLDGFDFSNITDAREMFSNCYNLYELGDLNFSKDVQMGSMCSNCKALKKIKSLNIITNNASYAFSGCNNLTTIEKINAINKYCTASIFANCPSFSNDTLKEILKYCSELTSQPSNKKTLSTLGLSSTQAQTCTTFTEWTTLSNNGWTTGY